MATKSELHPASGLQKRGTMLRVAVAILALVTVSGCGVGADESYDGQTLVASNGQALMAGPVVPQAGPAGNGPQTPVTAAPSPVKDPGTVALPQDPIPVFEGRTAMPTPMTTPMGSTAGVPPVPPVLY
jgi:hypothetical protein